MRCIPVLETEAIVAWNFRCFAMYSACRVVGVLESMACRGATFTVAVGRQCWVQPTPVLSTVQGYVTNVLMFWSIHPH